jgi:hypothetical protein
MITSSVQSSPAQQSETATKTPPRQNAEPQLSVPQDKVTISPQAQAQAQQAAQKAVSTNSDQDAPSK